MANYSSVNRSYISSKPAEDIRDQLYKNALNRMDADHIYWDREQEKLFQGENKYAVNWIPKNSGGRKITFYINMAETDGKTTVQVIGPGLKPTVVPQANTALDNLFYGTECTRIATASSESTTDGGCYVATAVYGSYNCPQVWTLRRYRDYGLTETWYGRAFIKTYYAISPTLVKWFGDTTWFKRMWRGRLDALVKKCRAKGYEDKPYKDRIW